MIIKKQYIKSQKITFSPKNQYGIKMYYPDTRKYPDAVTELGYGKFSVLLDEKGEIGDEKYRFYLRIFDDASRSWRYPAWNIPQFEDGFKTLNELSNCLSKYNWKDATVWHIDPEEGAYEAHWNEFKEAMNMLGFEVSKNHPMNDDGRVYDKYVYLDNPQSNDSFYNQTELYVRVIYYEDEIVVDYWVNGNRLPPSAKPPQSSDIGRTIKQIERFWAKYNYHLEVQSSIMTQDEAQPIMAAINTRDLTKNIVRVKSSNLWGICVHVRNPDDDFGDLICQFKGGTGDYREGPGAIYIYYDCPLVLYRRFVSAPSKGHFFWQYIRNTLRYSKLTGDKKGKLPHAVNNDIIFRQREQEEAQLQREQESQNTPPREKLKAKERRERDRNRR